ncbi:BCCT family transporter [Desulfoluna sp.]|uniref:BCCT family transporter n=1 Tax=Desulfoluna sp. TaxID=2045199 RepID=UPI00262E55DA|nr:BCCT family transporter [Desulfoluna sp.]
MNQTAVLETGLGEPVTSETEANASERQKINPFAFWPGYIVLILFIGLGLLNQGAFKIFIDTCKGWLSTHFGWLNVFSSMAIVIFTFCIAFSKIGNIRLGGEDATPEYTLWQWFSMALCGCIGIGILFWGMGDPIFHMMQPPQGLPLVPGSRDAGIFAISQAVLHWSVAQYCIYTICGVAIALVAYNKRYPLSVAAGVYSLFPRSWRPAMTSIIHATCLFSLCCAVACSLGAGLMQLGSGVGFLLNVTLGKVMWGILAVGVIGMYTFSSTTGIKRGMQFLSAQCTRIFFVFMLFTLLFGPTLFILTVGTEAFGYFVGNFFRNSMLLNAMVPNDPWPANWIPVFMASFFTYAPLLGLFLARLGRGRTIRQFILVNVFPPTVFCYVWMFIFGGTAVQFQWSGVFDIWAAVQQNGFESTAYAIFQQFPMSTLLIVVFVITVAISFATLADPMTSVLATLSTKGLRVEEEAPIRLKIIWGLTTGTIAYLLVASGGVSSLRGMLSLAGFPMMILTLFMCVSVVKEGLFLLGQPKNYVDKSDEFIS